MTLLKIDLSSVTKSTYPDDAVSLWSPVHRGSSAGVVITTAPTRTTLIDGKADVEVEPGPLMVHIQARGMADHGPKQVVVPDTSSVSLLDLFEQFFTYDPPVVGRVALDAQRAESAAVRAEAGAAMVGDAQDVLDARDDTVAAVATLGDAQTVLTARDEAVTARDEAEQIAATLPITIQSDLDTRVPPLVSEAIATDTTVTDAARVAVAEQVASAANTTTVAGGTTSTAHMLLKTNSLGKLTVTNASITGGGDVVNKSYVDTSITAGRWSRTALASGTDLNAHLALGIHWANATVAATILNMPDDLAGQAFTITNTPGYGAYLRQDLSTFRGTTGEIDQRYRWTLNGTDWSPWKRVLTDRDLPALTPDVESDGTAPVGHRRDVLKHRSRLRRGGVIGTNGATPVALTFDHGYVAFRDKVLPHLRRLGLPATSATQPAQMGTGENEGITWGDLQTWGLNNGVEYAHHAWSHSDVADARTNIAALSAALLNSITTHATEMPELVSDAFIMPGVSGTKWDGFNGGNNTTAWWDHPAGRLLTDNFPVISGTTPGYAVPMIGGEDQTWTMYRWSWDTPDRADELKQHITALHGTGAGMAVFMHPNVLDTTDRTTEAKLIEVLEWLAAERDAGRVEVLTLSGFAYADTTATRRLDLAPAAGWVGDTRTVSLTPMWTWARGGQFLLETTATTSGPLTLSATSDTGGLNATVTHEAVAGKRYAAAFSIPTTASTLTLTAAGSGRACRAV